MKLSELAKDLREKRLAGGDAEIKGLCTDSRVAEEGDLFFCFGGTNADSHFFAEEAERRGAAGLVCERELPLSCPQLIVPDGREGMSRIAAAFYGHPERALRIVGVTGTNGKTTVVHMLAGILAEAGRKTGIIGTLGARYGDRAIPPTLTTPDPVGLFSLLADMRRAGTEIVAMEVSAHALALRKELPIRYEIAIFTNLTQDHLDFFGDMEHYAAAKKSLFTPERAKFAVLNADDPFYPELAAGLPHSSYGLECPADSFALIEKETVRCSSVLLNLSDELCETKIPLPGRHNVCNALAAATAARRLGATPEQISRGLSGMESVDGRLEWVGRLNGADIFVDFAHTPDGIGKSLAALAPHCAGKLYCLFGCGGNRDASKRALMGKAAEEGADFCILTSDNPRYEDPCAIISEIEKGFSGKNYVAIEERERAIEYAMGLLKKGDALLVAGKGGECYLEIMGIKYAYNDKDVIESLLGKMKQ